VTDWLDWAYTEIRDRVDDVWPQWTPMIALPLLVLALLIVAAQLENRIVPLIGRLIVAPAVAAVSILAGLAVLALQVLLIAPWRAARRRPPAALYALGDLTVAAMMRIRPLRHVVTFPFRVLPVLLILLGVVLWRWNGTYCERMSHLEAPCRSPYSVMYKGATEWWQTVQARDRQSTNARG